jgi:hypothetical protein
VGLFADGGAGPRSNRLNHLEGSEITLPSFDIASAMYHADMAALMLGSVYELRILAETQRFLGAKQWKGYTSAADHIL